MPISCKPSASRMRFMTPITAMPSAEHLVRGRQWLKQGENDLAISDFTKALDLYRGNTEARIARAQAYRAKGNWRLAEEDERPV